MTSQTILQLSEEGFLYFILGHRFNHDLVSLLIKKRASETVLMRHEADFSMYFDEEKPLNEQVLFLRTILHDTNHEFEALAEMERLFELFDTFQEKYDRDQQGDDYVEEDNTEMVDN